LASERELRYVASRRTTARGLIVAAVAVTAIGLAGAVSAAPSGAVPRLIFPIVGAVAFTNDFGAARYSGTHQGNDLMAPRRTIAVAAEPGKVKFWTTSARAGCMLYLYGKSGTTYLYIHLNNDVTKGNDNRGACVPGMAYAKGLKDGDNVEAGQAIGYVGNSGDADSTDPHLHFEVHPNDGDATNPFPYLMKAERLIFATAPKNTVTLTVTGNVLHAATGQLAVKVTKLQAFPAGAVLDKMRRPLQLGVADTVQVDLGGGKVVGANAAPRLEGHEVLVLTEPTAATLAAAAVRPGAYKAGRVVLAARGR
jgi:murein DD-endopeptidase MepM/ murein hydrolase activator NlpD